MPPRKSITNAQKAALRTQRQLQPHLSNLEIRDWFQQTYNQSISPSSVSEILSSRYQSLDTTESLRPTLKKRRKEHWPELENALYQWIYQAETRIIISGEVIREKARFFWNNLPGYKEHKMPVFSNGWLHSFQSRRAIKANTLHGEEGSVQNQTEEEMIAIRQVLSAYSPCNIFNCDESALYWKMIPDWSLTTQHLPGRKKEKARITAHFCCNADGTEKLPIWFIGTARRPWAFQAAGIHIENLNLIWKSNQKAWMTSQIMEEWLRWFDNKMTGRKVVLLMDNFSAHEAAMQTINSSMLQLQNTLIIWVPANSTSCYQPLDQGIIHTWKTYWRRQWVLYMLHEYEAGENPFTTMNVLKALHWGIQAWEINLKASTIERCFKKALYNPQIILSNSEAIEDISQGLIQLQAIDRIKDVMDINQFLNPLDEKIEDDVEQLDEQILAQFQPVPEEDSNSDEEEEVLPQISHSNALNALQTVCLYKEQQQEGLQGVIQALNHLENEIGR